jgi:NitT/TauT family transport system substrate-binding protein
LDWTAVVRRARAAAALLCTLWAASASGAETIRVSIGHQSLCTDTYSAGVIVKELKLLEKHLPHTGKYAGASYEMDWKDYDSGPPITNMMLANKLDFGVMGDYPLIVNGSKFQETESLRTLYVSGTGYNLKGAGNAVVVPIDSPVNTLQDLKGKAVSVPVGSAAWGMTLKALQDVGLSDGSVEIRNQSPPVGATNIAQKKVDAHADFCPWSELMEFRGTGRKIYDGSETGVAYLHGVVVRKDYAERYPEIVVAFTKAVVDAGNWVREDPARAAQMLEKWTGVEKEVQYLYFSRGGHLTLDPTIKPRWVETLKQDHAVLAKERAIPALDFSTWIDDRYIRQGYKELGLDYAKEVESIWDPLVENVKLPPAEAWHPTRGIVSYPSVSAMLAEYAKAAQGPEKPRATYVYDQVTRVKLFGHVASYVKAKDGSYAPFLRKTDAEKFAAESSGKVLSFSAALVDVAAVSR